MIIDKEEKPRFRWWQDIFQALFVVAMVSFVVVMGVDAMSREKLGDCTVCLWERIK